MEPPVGRPAAALVTDRFKNDSLPRAFDVCFVRKSLPYRAIRGLHVPGACGGQKRTTQQKHIFFSSNRQTARRVHPCCEPCVRGPAALTDV